MQLKQAESIPQTILTNHPPPLPLQQEGTGGWYVACTRSMTTNDDTYRNNKDLLAAGLCNLTWVKVRAQAMNSEVARQMIMRASVICHP